MRLMLVIHIACNLLNGKIDPGCRLSTVQTILLGRNIQFADRDMESACENVTQVLVIFLFSLQLKNFMLFCGLRNLGHIWSYEIL